MGMIPYEYQNVLAKQAEVIFKAYSMVYLAMEERTGKSVTSLLVMENSSFVNNVLIITKKKALDGWKKTLENCSWLTKNYTLVNYHSSNKLNPSASDAIILDEAHSYVSTYPKRGKIWKDVALLCKNKPIIYLSATPYAQGIQLLFNQLALSTNSPWKRYKNFYAWYNDYAERDKNGQTETIRIKDRYIKTYKKVMHKKAMLDVAHLFIVTTRVSLNFNQEPEDVLHYLKLSDQTRLAYNTLIKHKVLDFDVSGTSYRLIADSKLKLRIALHMMEGGVLKVDDVYVCLNTQEKISYILDNWGDNSNVVIMYQYIAEGDKLRAVFKKATILQGTSYAEGIDLSHIEHLIIYSQDFSTAKHTQRRARQANKERKTPIKVHFLLVENAISWQVYRAVSVNKRNFVDSVFEEQKI